eukprot:GHUV01049729.1.p2 GENE.GHUV01049729.1~~GHUV01049729.1.p2  ORF type:complete len:102 (-),score=18.36 GHUV01049729.1:917-1222(-)
MADEADSWSLVNTSQRYCLTKSEFGTHTSDSTLHNLLQKHSACHSGCDSISAVQTSTAARQADIATAARCRSQSMQQPSATTHHMEPQVTEFCHPSVVFLA